MRFAFGTRWLDAIGFAAAYAVSRGFPTYVLAAWTAVPTSGGMPDGELVVVDHPTWEQLGGRAMLGVPLAVYGRHGNPLLDAEGRPDFERPRVDRGA